LLALDFVLERFSKAAGRSLRISEAVYRSEAETGNRNRAIGYLLLRLARVGDDGEAGVSRALSTVRVGAW
jgi:glutaminase